ncbi:MAG: hypothetical protein HUU50_09635 [Candidatus Brocadiae bacterium]|nr:hypothetical protein [Candidatus Brocadiia bacterium]
MELKYQKIYLFVFAFLMLVSFDLNAASYSGSLSVSDGSLIATAFWNNPLTSISWQVDDTTTSGLWHYEYRLVTATKAISHWIIEASDGSLGPAFTLANLFNVITQPLGWVDDVTIDTHASGSNPNPYMPEDLYGIKFDSAINSTTVTLVFDSDRVPVWGDFYAKCGATSGVINTVYNAGFTTLDPTDPVANGTLYNHIIVPDSHTVAPPVPEPGTFWMALIALGFTYRFIAKKK